jgi:hypothetical protein
MAVAGVEFGQRVMRGRNRTEEGIIETIKVLLDAGADINAQMVSEPGRRFVVNGSQLAQGNTYRARGQQVPSPLAVPHATALHGAAQHGYNSVVELLVERGADLTIRDASGSLPLDVAMGEYQEDFRTTKADPLLDTASLIRQLMAERGIDIE